MSRTIATVVLFLLLIPGAGIFYELAKRHVRANASDGRKTQPGQKAVKTRAMTSHRPTLSPRSKTSQLGSVEAAVPMSPDAEKPTSPLPQQAATPASSTAAVSDEQRDGIVERLKELAQTLNINVEFHESVKNEPADVDRQGSPARQFDAILMRYGLTYVEMPLGGIIVFNAAQSKLFDQFAVKTVRVTNSAEDLAAELQALLGKDEDGGRSVRVSKEPNTLMVKAPAREMGQIVSLIRALDQRPAEALVEIEIWSTSKEVQTELGNQMSTTYNLPALLQGNLLKMLVMPASSASLLRSSGVSKLVASAQLQIQHNKKRACRFGKNTGGGVVYGGTNDATSPFYSGESGIGVEVTARIKEDQTDIQLILNAAGGNGQFQSLATSGSIPDQRSVVLARAMFDYNTDVRRGLFPFSMLPLFGRAFSLPKIDKGSANLVVSVKSTITRPAVEVPDHFQFNRVRSINEYLITGNENRSSANRLRRVSN